MGNTREILNVFLVLVVERLLLAALIVFVVAVSVAGSPLSVTGSSKSICRGIYPMLRHSRRNEVDIGQTSSQT